MPLPQRLAPLCCLCKVGCLLSQVLPMVKNTLKTKLGLKISRGLTGNGQRSTPCWCSCLSQGQSRQQSFVHPTLMPVLVLGLIKIKSNEIQAVWEKEDRDLKTHSATHIPAIQHTAQAGHRHPFAATPHNMQYTGWRMSLRGLPALCSACRASHHSV